MAAPARIAAATAFLRFSFVRSWAPPAKGRMSHFVAECCVGRTGFLGVENGFVTFLATGHRIVVRAHILGTAVVDAIIDERGNVVQTRAISRHPLLIAAALRAVLQWKYEPTSLNGQPISVELQVSVNFSRL